MSREQILSLLRLLAGAFPTLEVTDAVIDAWQFTLCDEDPMRILLAARYLIKTRASSAFMPTVGELLAASRQLEGGTLSSSEEAWARGPRSANNTPLDAEVWRAWGGKERWAGLPDPKYCEDVPQASQVLSFARKEFIDLHASTSATRAKAPLHLTHQQSVDSLKMLEAHGIQTMKLLGR